MLPKHTNGFRIEEISNVEKFYLEKSGKKLIYQPTEKIPVIQVENFPMLGKLTAQRFIEWSIKNPGGVISLPTGKTPEHFIKWVTYYLRNWDKSEVKEDLNLVGIDTSTKPDMFSLHFVQIDEFYPIDSLQHNSFYFYIQRYYLTNFNLDPEKALLINVNKIPTAENLPLDQIFPQQKVDLSLRTKLPSTKLERLQKTTIEFVDEFCTNYERKIRELGGIGFFLGGIGPDGHIGFNVQGSDHFSTTRLTEINYQTQAAASTDLGGIENARNRLVITIGLSTIVYNQDSTAVIMAAGESKSRVVRDAIEKSASNLYPATILQELKNARFYLTEGAALRLNERRFNKLIQENPISNESIERNIINLAVNKKKRVLDLDETNYQEDKFCLAILKNTNQTYQQLNEKVNENILQRINKGLKQFKSETFLHTGPHHDDIMAGYLPLIVHLVREPLNKHYFATMTSGFTAVTNSYMLNLLYAIKRFISELEFRERFTTNYFEFDNVEGKNRDVNLYLDGIAYRSRTLKDEAIARRMVRNLIEIYNEDTPLQIEQRVNKLIQYFKNQYPGKKDVSNVQKLKGMLREFEEELVWAHFGINTQSIFHLRLGFYKGKIFNENPELNRDVIPILNLFREINPSIITVTLDPEGTGPDTHYKVLQATAEALKIYQEETDVSNLKVWGYRNVWNRFHPAEANLYVPVSLNSFAIMDSVFKYSYGSQREASFPSYELDGPFSRLAQNIQVEQYQTIRTCLGRDYFLKNNIPRIRAAHGMIYIKEMTTEEFYAHTRELKRLIE